MPEDKVTLYEMTGKHHPSGWESDQDRDNYIDEATRYGSAMCQWTSEGKMRHVPRPEWMPPAPDETDKS
jgi:hypothetical protein